MYYPNMLIHVSHHTWMFFWLQSSSDPAFEADSGGGARYAAWKLLLSQKRLSKEVPLKYEKNCLLPNWSDICYSNHSIWLKTNSIQMIGLRFLFKSNDQILGYSDQILALIWLKFIRIKVIGNYRIRINLIGTNINPIRKTLFRSFLICGVLKYAFPLTARSSRFTEKSRDVTESDEIRQSGQPALVLKR